MVLGRITTGRHTHKLGWCHPIRTNQESTSINPPFLSRMAFLPQPSQFIVAWDRHQICWLAYHVAWLLLSSNNINRATTKMPFNVSANQRLWHCGARLMPRLACLKPRLLHHVTIHVWWTGDISAQCLSRTSHNIQESQWKLNISIRHA